MKFFTIFGDIVRNLICGPVTRKYPYEVREPFAGERGRLEIEEDKCIYCGMCQRKCPSHAITVTRAPQKVWRFERMRCILCSSCVDNCPKKCLKLVPRNAPEK